MTDPLLPASSQSIRLPQTGESVRISRPETPLPGQGEPGRSEASEKLQLSGSQRREADNGKLAQGVAQAALQALDRAESALSQIQSLVVTGQASAPNIHPHAMQILEASAVQYQGISPLDHNGTAIQSDGQRVPAYPLAGENTDALISLSSIVPASTSQEGLQVSMDNVKWAKEQYRTALHALDSQQIQNAEQVSPAQAPASADLNPEMHSGIQPQRVVALISGP